MQNGEIECKMVKLSAKQWLTAPTKLSLDKQNGGKQLNEDWNAQKDLITALNTKLSKIYKKLVIAKCVRWEKNTKAAREKYIHLSLTELKSVCQSQSPRHDKITVEKVNFKISSVVRSKTWRRTPCIQHRNFQPLKKQLHRKPHQSRRDIGFHLLCGWVRQFNCE